MKLMSLEELVGGGVVSLDVPVPNRLSDYKHKKVSIGKTRKANLRKLASYLYALPYDYSAKQFDMRNYCADESCGSIPVEDWECGTVACAAGHGPAAGIAVADSDEEWEDYIGRVFIGRNSTSDYIFEWLFESFWKNTDNTPQGAARRIVYMLEYGIPLRSNGDLCQVLITKLADRNG